MSYDFDEYPMDIAEKICGILMYLALFAMIICFIYLIATSYFLIFNYQTKTDETQ